MEKEPSKYKLSSFKTFRRHCKDRVLQLADMRLTILARYVRVASKNPEMGEKLRMLLDSYDVLIRAEEAFFVYLSAIVKDCENG